MKILHTSDLHLGKIVNGYSFIEDQKHILNQIPPIIEKENIDVLVIAGDVFDRAIAPVEALQLWDDLLISISQLNIYTLIINGNHDSMKRLNFGQNFLIQNNIFIISKSVLYEKHTINGVNFYLLPFLTLEETSFITDQKFSDFTTLKKYIVNEININENETNIIIDHSYIISGKEDIETDSSIRPLSLGGSEFTASDVYQKFNLVLVGHIHRHSFIKPNIYYSGSILPYSIGERNNKHGYYIHEIDKQITSTYWQFNKLRQMRLIELYIDQLDKHTYSEDYVALKILDNYEILNIIEKVNKKFPNVLQIERNYAQTEITDIDRVDQISIEKAFSTFYEMNSEEKIADDSLQFFLQAYNDIKRGEIDETS